MTRAFRQLVKSLRFPTLTAVNDKIAGAVSKMQLPPSIGVRWDNALEKKEVAVTITASSLDMWAQAVHNLSKETVALQVGAILDEL